MEHCKLQNGNSRPLRWERRENHFGKQHIFPVIPFFGICPTLIHIHVFIIVSVAKSQKLKKHLKYSLTEWIQREYSYNEMLTGSKKKYTTAKWIVMDKSKKKVKWKKQGTE